MNLAQFNSKALDQQAALVGRQGIYLVKCDRLTYSCCLFYVPDFYVEVWYERESKKIFYIRGFTGLWGLECYLNLIDLKNIQPILD